MPNRAFVLLVAALLISGTLPSAADIATDGSVGPALQLTGPDFLIPNSLGSQRGANLFHSFSRFSIADAESATFTSDFDGLTRNVISRITGPAPSTINGRLASTVPGASLWLLNPNGVIFGADASLDVPAGVALSSASYLVLQDGSRFGIDLNDPGDSLLSTAPVSAFGFLDAPAPLAVLGDLSVPRGNNITLAGGDLSIRGAVTARAGQLNLVALRSAGELQLDTTGAVVDASVDSFTSLADIDIGNPGADVPVLQTSGDRPGTLYIRGDIFLLDGIVGAAAGDTPGEGAGVDIEARSAMGIGTRGDEVSAVFTRSDGITPAPDISIRTPLLVVTGNGTIASAVSSDASGASGDLHIAVDQLFAAGTITTSTLGIGDSGDIHISGYQAAVADSVVLEGLFSGVTADSGTILTDDNGNPVFDGNGDTIPVGVDGRAGNIQIDAKQLTINSGIGITTDTVSSAGGQITLNVDEMLLLSGATSTASFGDGDAGAIRIRGAGSSESSTRAARSIEINGAGFILGKIGADAFDDGDAGNILIRSEVIRLVDGGIIANTTNSGQGGTIELSVDRLELISPELDVNPLQSTVTSNTNGSGDAGRIIIRGVDSTNGQITPSTEILLSAGISGGLQTSSFSDRDDAGARRKHRRPCTRVRRAGANTRGLQYDQWRRGFHHIECRQAHGER